MAVTAAPGLRRRRPAGAGSLDAAGITDARLREDLLVCRALHAEHGRTYFLATALLPPAKRPWVWALYGFARYADEFVDSLTSPDPRALVDWGAGFLAALRSGEPADPVGRAMLATVRRWEIPPGHVEAFLASMRMDITRTGYATYADLEGYMYGSASVIGLQMLPVLEPLPGLEAEAAVRAQRLGEAFQMSNFIRDVGEDLERGRVYLPAEDLAAAGVTREDLLAARRSGHAPPAVVELLRAEVARTRELYRQAEPGIAMLHPTSRDAIRCAYELYGGILGAVERAEHQVLHRRVAVSLPRRLAVAGPALVRARAARRQRHR
ncbi:phytoene/squalene synthase family protein [Quadrisphaera sp. DSM 44207]|uniref:phytoene/squalene synthase family protein n=1 Tax=Quadrisphaera sp. DSM 44207 TaxID=1881057 RepID=UPI00088860B5|nr:phytoene/squalene synthase family protein [Quadrisphaera sp. DSM 44207]SDQ77786.1 phytoene synthase [Quadrisphaera sp. DSM 44207]